MKRVIIFALLLGWSLPGMTANLANGEKMNDSCALCHGIYGQGAPGKLSPRIAGLPKEYLIKSIKEYRDGEHRKYGLMVYTAQLDKVSDSDIEFQPIWHHWI
jgi:cytochrome c553